MVAVWQQHGKLSFAFLCYAGADTLSAILPPTITILSALCAAESEAAAGGMEQPQPPPSSSSSSSSSSGSSNAAKIVSTLLTLAVNAAYNLPCLSVAWEFSQCFELADPLEPAMRLTTPTPTMQQPPQRQVAGAVAAEQEQRHAESVGAGGT
eukprot:COSAG06_NODE_1114_length_10647_cov_3.831532_9_plen_152_part_00